MNAVDIKPERLNDEVTGDCPYGGCSRPAYAYVAKGIVHGGYVDACFAHARKALFEHLQTEGIIELRCALCDDVGCTHRC
jgi:hypothetical protein